MLQPFVYIFRLNHCTGNFLTLMTVLLIKTHSDFC